MCSNHYCTRSRRKCSTSKVPFLGRRQPRDRSMLVLVQVMPFIIIMHETVAWVGSGSSIKPHEALQPIIRCSTATSNLSTMPAKVLAISTQPCDVNIGCVFRPHEIYTLTGYYAPTKPMTTAYLNVDAYLSDYKPTRTWLPFPGSKPINLCAKY